MPERTLPGLGLTGFWDLGADSWKAAMDTNIQTLSVLVNGAALSRTTPLPGSPSAGDIYIVPSGAGSNPNKVAVYDGDSGSEAWVYLTPNAGWAFYVVDEGKNYQFDGTDWAEFAGAGGGGGGGGGSYDMRFGFSSPPAAGAVIDTVIIVRDMTLPADLAGSLGVVGTNPAAPFVLGVEVDSTQIATATIGTDGSFTFSTTGGTSQGVPAGSVLTLVGPNPSDASIADMALTLYGVED